MVWWKTLIGATLVACAAWLINREWYTFLMMNRVRKWVKPDDGPRTLAQLVRALPASDTPKYVILAIQPKMGTTWVGHITHQLLSHGRAPDPAMHLMEDSPYPEFGEMLFGKGLHELSDPAYWKRDPFGSFPDGPVTIRTHMPHAVLRKISATEKEHFRLVSVFRDPADTILSRWRFMPTVAGIDYKLVPIASIVRVMRFGGWLERMFVDYADFWERRHDPNVLLIFFEDLKRSLSESVRRLADFLPLQPALTEEEFGMVVNQSTYEFMTDPAIAGRFNEAPRPLQEAMWKRMGIEKDVKVEFSSVGTVRKEGGKSGEGKGLPDDVKATLAGLWEQHVLPRTGCRDLEEMRLKFEAERGASTSR